MIVNKQGIVFYSLAISRHSVKRAVESERVRSLFFNLSEKLYYFTCGQTIDVVPVVFQDYTFPRKMT